MTIQRDAFLCRTGLADGQRHSQDGVSTKLGCRRDEQIIVIFLLLTFFCDLYGSLIVSEKIYIYKNCKNCNSIETSAEMIKISFFLNISCILNYIIIQ